MRHVFMGLALATACCTTAAQADELLFQYEGDVLPLDAGWFGRPCVEPCHESIEDGRLVFRFIGGGIIVDYSQIIAYPDEPPLDVVGRVAVPLQLDPWRSPGLRRAIPRAVSRTHGDR